MKKEIKDLWVKALLSGEYKQGDGVLYNAEGNTYCCLGVLSDLAMQEGVCDYDELLPDYSHGRVGSFDGSYGLLPDSVKKWADIRYNSGDVLGHRSLVTQNDAGQSFKQIAAFIEKHWEEL